MASVEWKIKTRRLATCSCDYGCPCEFSAQPTRVPCEGVEALKIIDGTTARSESWRMRATRVQADDRRVWTVDCYLATVGPAHPPRVCISR